MIGPLDKRGSAGPPPYPEGVASYGYALCASTDELSKIFVGHRRKIDRVLMTERVCRIAADRNSLQIWQDLLEQSEPAVVASPRDSQREPDGG
jgi:hypothetical protein